MEKGPNPSTNIKENPSLLPNNPSSNQPNKKDSHQDSPQKPFSGNGGVVGGGNDRLKRDEWSEGAVSSLLEAYEAKWVLRNRAKLKGHDWEDVARFVSSRANCSKSPKTQTQCKNKIESMKKRYRSESATAGAEPSSWPLFSRLDLLLRGTGGGGGCAFPPPPPPPPPPQAINNPSPFVLVEPAPQRQSPSPPPPPPQPAFTQAPQVEMPKEDREGTKLSNQDSDPNKVPIDTDSSTPALYESDGDDKQYSPKAKKARATEKKRKRQRREDGYWEVAESIRWLTEVVARSETARMETMRDLERMRMEAEAKRGEMELKRTEIVANTQLEIARIFAAACGSSAGGGGKNVDSSLRIGRN